MCSVQIVQLPENGMLLRLQVESGVLDSGIMRQVYTLDLRCGFGGGKVCIAWLGLTVCPACNIYSSDISIL